MEILCFRSDKEQHNISCFTEVFGRYEKLPMDYIGLPAVNIDYEGDEVYASVGLVQNKAKTADYWGEGTGKAFPNCVKQHMLAKRHYIGKISDDWFPINSEGEAKPHEQLMDDSELVHIIWEIVVEKLGYE